MDLGVFFTPIHWASQCCILST